MELRIEYSGFRSLGELLDRVKQVAEANGKTQEDAIREALYAWLRQFSANQPYRSIEVTDKEYQAVAAVLAAIREAR